MSLVAATNAPSPRLQGRVEGLEGRSVLGWAWHADGAGERLRVEALVNEDMVAAAIADGARLDLRRNGIGDGSHAFALLLPDDAALEAAAAGRLVVRVTSETGGRLDLRIPTLEERTAEAAVAAPAARIMERLDILLAAQHQLHIAQRDVAGHAKGAAERLEHAGAVGAEIGVALGATQRLEADLGERVGQAEGFLARMDATLAGFDARLEAIESAGREDGRAAVRLLAVLSGTVIGSVLTVLAR